MRIKGHSIAAAGADDGDIVVVDKSVKPEHGKIVIAYVDGEFICKRLYMKNGKTRPQAENPDFGDHPFQGWKNAGSVVRGGNPPFYGGA